MRNMKRNLIYIVASFLLLLGNYSSAQIVIGGGDIWDPFHPSANTPQKEIILVSPPQIHKPGTVTPPSGTLKYEARDAVYLKTGFSFKANSDYSLSASTKESIVLSADYLSNPVNPATKPINTSAPVGLTQGSASVSPTGAANYQIPIFIPQGIAGMQPSLSIVYNSQSGSSTLGYGWGLSGLSAISRVPKTIFSNGTSGGINFDLNDIYSLDGNRLLALNNASYGTENTSYETEVKTFSKIESVGFINEIIGTRQNASGPSWFRVTTKDGNIVEYGNSSDSKVVPGGLQAPYMWLINKVTDPNGNFMTFTYKQRYGEASIEKIEYTGNGSSTASNSILFFYDSKSDSKTNYISGRYIENGLLLRKIKVVTEGVVVRTYDFDYYTNNTKTCLNLITETGRDGKSLNSTAIGWGAENSATGVRVISVNIGNVDYTDKMQLFSADVNGDGKSELIIVKPSILASDGTCSSYIVNVFSTSDYSSFNLLYSYNIPNFSSRYYKSINSSLVFGDINFDGKKEIILPTFVHGTGPTCTIDFQPLGDNSISSILQYSSEMPVFTVGDFNNDGIDEIVYIERGKDSNGYYTGKINYFKNRTQKKWVDYNLLLPSKPVNIYTADFNGDGLLDMYVVCENASYFIQNKGSSTDGDGYSIVTFTNNGINTDIKDEYSEIAPGDFNGDGLVDFVYNEHCNNKWHLALNNGNWGFNITDLSNIGDIEENFTEKNDDKDDCIVTDFNHDGKSDLIIVDAMYHKESDASGSWGVFDNTNVYWWASTGSGFTEYQTISSSNEFFSYKKNIATGDFDGDGKEDLINYGADLFGAPTSDNSFRIYSTFNPSSPSFDGLLVNNISNGFNQKTNFTYQPINYKASEADNFYSKGTSSTYPIIDIVAPLYCVKSVTSPDGVGGTSITNYSYAEARAQLTGKGFLGFSGQTAANAVSNRKTVSTSVLDNSNLLPSKQTVKVKTLGGLDLSYTESNYSNSKIGNSYFSYLANAVSTDYLTNITTTTTNDYNGDTNGNLYKVTTCQGDGFSKEAKYENYVAAGSWLPNKPQKITTSQTHPNDGTPFSLITLYSYNAATGNLTTETENSGISGKEAVTTYSDFDTWGHPLSVASLTPSEGGALNVSKTFVFDSKGRYLKSVTDNSGTVSSEYDPVSLTLTSSTDVNGLKTSYRYDSWGRLVETRLPDGNITTSSIYWGDVTNVANPFYYTYSTATGRPWVKTGYDAMGRVMTEETVGFNELSLTSNTIYNAKGQVIQKISKSGGNVTSQLDYTYYNDGTLKDGRLLNESNVNTSGNIKYDYTGKTITTLVNGKTYSKTYDNWGNIKEITEPSPGGNISYIYFSNGKPKSINYPAASVQMTYDELGYQKTLTDPSSGTSTYRYDALGRLTYQKDGNGKETTLFYDNFGHISEKKINNVSTAQYEYYTSGDGKGQIKKVTAQNGTWDSYEYDGFGRVIKTTTHIDGTISDIVYQNHYDSYGNEDQITYPGNYVVSQQYDSYGNLKAIQGGGRNIWSLDAMDASKLKYTLGNGQVTTKLFDSKTGLLTSITTTNGTVEAQKQAYTFDAAKGLLISREDQRTGYNLKESFSYDDINRLTDWNVAKNGTITSTYSIQYDNDTIGNINVKTGVGRYLYSDPNPSNIVSPHAVKRIFPGTTGYNPPQQDLTYTDFGKVQSIKENGLKLNFTYGTDDERVKADLTQEGGETLYTNYYAGLYEVKKTPDGIIKEFLYIPAGDGIAAVLVKTSYGPDCLYYIHKDHLGSIVCLTLADGTIREQMNYDPWGRRRNVSDWSFTNVPTPTILTRGFTGHEHLNEFAMINMNGRVYDPVLGMFISPDNFVQSPTSSQNFNRYSYCLNNPLIYTDPSGELFWIIPNISWSKEGGLSLGVSFVVGIPGGASAQIGVGYNFKSKDPYIYAGATLAMNTVYTSYSPSGGWNAGYTVGASPFSGLPISTNFLTVGANYNITHDSWNGNVSAWNVDKNGWTFDPSVSVIICPEHTTNFVRGQGFRTNNQVLSNFVKADNYQGALDYFGIEGRYDPNFNEEGGTDKNGNIVFSDLAFKRNFDYLRYVASEEKFHQNDLRSGNYKDIDWKDKNSFETVMAKNKGEFKAKNYQYRNQGLFRNAYGNNTMNRIIRDINSYGGQMGYPDFVHRNWHSIYRIPRLW